MTEPNKKSEPKRTIGLVLPDLRGGGAERVSISLAHEFARRQIEVTFLLLREEGELLTQLPDQARVVSLHASRIRDGTMALARYLRQEKPDALLSNMWPITTMCVVAHKLARSRARHVTCDHNNLSRQYAGRGIGHKILMRASLSATYRLADSRVGVSSGVIEDLAALSGIPQVSFDVIYNPIPRPARPVGHSQAESYTLWGSQDALRILSVGSLIKQKNPILLVRAFARLCQNTEAILLLLGEGPMREEIEDAARAEGIGDKVIMPGFDSNTTPYYRSADLFVLSSDYEGFGNVIVEALACGLPVLSTDCPSGPAEILEHGRYGRLVPVGDAEALAKAMKDALMAEHNKEDLIQRATFFSPEVVADKYLDLLFPNDGTK